MNFDTSLRELAYVVTISSAIIAACLYLWRNRKTSMNELRIAIARAWTNEGDILATESRYMMLDLALEDGEVFGSLRVNIENQLLEAHIDVAWGRAYLQVSRLWGNRILPVGKVRLRLTGNRNRLKWKMLDEKEKGILPKKTLLWPSTLGNKEERPS